MHQILCDTCGKVWTKEDRESLFLVSAAMKTAYSIDAWPEFGWKGDQCSACVRKAMEDIQLVDEGEMDTLRYHWKEERDRRLNADEPILPVFRPQDNAGLSSLSGAAPGYRNSEQGD